MRILDGVPIGTALIASAGGPSPGQIDGRLTIDATAEPGPEATLTGAFSVDWGVAHELSGSVHGTMTPDP